jgi:hypothetical protein
MDDNDEMECTPVIPVAVIPKFPYLSATSPNASYPSFSYPSFYNFLKLCIPAAPAGGSCQLCLPLFYQINMKYIIWKTGITGVGSRDAGIIGCFPTEWFKNLRITNERDLPLLDIEIVIISVNCTMNVFRNLLITNELVYLLYIVFDLFWCYLIYSYGLSLCMLSG